MVGCGMAMPLKFSKATFPEDIQDNRFLVIADHEIHIRDHFTFFALMSIIIKS
jgi:hypothetical protein